MTNDEKAKAYDEALERAKKIHDEILNNELLGFPDQIREIFPELRGSEDERIRKWLVDYFSSIKKTVWIHRDITCEQILDWLEKQKEQNKCPEFCSGHCVGCEQKEQKPAEWSEEDENIRQSIIKYIEWERNNTPVTVDKDIRKYNEQIAWLKSLRPSWKPSEEQMGALMLAIEGKCPPTSYMSRRLEDLYEGLANTFGIDAKLD